MIVLIVDDQISVVSAIMSGIHWNEIGVTKVLKAYNAFEAKDILRTQPVDIMLCDIEMPAEDGLNLFRWTKEHQYDLECIFLTSHADFHYAKEALQLGSFDYILQPARYEDVQAALQKAARKVQERREYDSYYSYGKLLQNEQSLLQDSLLSKWLQADRIDPGQFQEDMERLNLNLRAEQPFCFALLQFLKASAEQGKPTENDELFRYGISNILAELGSHYGQESLLLRRDAESYALLLYGGEEPLNEEVFAGLLQRFLDTCRQYYGSRLAAYSAGVTEIAGLPGRVRDLLRLQENDVSQSVRVLSLQTQEEEPRDRPDQSFSVQQPRWNALAAQGNFRAVELELEAYLDKLAKDDRLTAERLQQFYQNFMQLVFQTLADRDMDIRDILPDYDQWQRFMSAYHSVEETRAMLHLMSDALEGSTAPAGDGDQMEAMVRYIHDNIEKDIRRSDLAASVYLSPDYVSHLFRQKLNMSFSDFVTSEKMKVARALLRTSSLPISVIAMKVGYFNFSYFSKTYKKVFGVTPAGERKSEA